MTTASSTTAGTSPLSVGASGDSRPFGSAEVGNYQMDWPGGAAADGSPDVGGEH